MRTAGTSALIEDNMGSCYKHPTSGDPLKLGIGGHLYDMQGRLAFECHEGSFDFVVDDPSRKERAHYDAEYVDGGWTTKVPLDMVDYRSLWELDVSSKEYLQSMGNLVGKRILLLGNGTSIKEFLFVKLGAQVFFTDLSFDAVKYAKRRYQASLLGNAHPENCQFHAVNARYLPDLPPNIVPALE